MKWKSPDQRPAVAGGLVPRAGGEPLLGCLDTQSGKEISAHQPDAGGFALVRRIGRRTVNLHLQPGKAAIRGENAGKDVVVVMHVLEFHKSEEGTVPSPLVAELSSVRVRIRQDDQLLRTRDWKR